jgi:hypothetical protein
MSTPEAKPLPKKLFARLESAGIESFRIDFSFESDEGAVEVATIPYDADLSNEITEWVFEAYSYDQTIAGYGNGERYCDSVEYDLKSKTVKNWGWKLERQEREEEEEFLEIR